MILSKWTRVNSVEFLVTTTETNIKEDAYILNIIWIILVNNLYLEHQLKFQSYPAILGQFHQHYLETFLLLVDY